MEQTTSLLQMNYGFSMDLQQVQDIFGQDDVVLICARQQWLQEIRVCLGRTNDGFPTMERRTCPPKVLESGSCGTVIRLAKFPG
mmetsp:Transcript_8457/g.19605  ORF Transcript_8457/g.19605 Transcript_8457/m.19605 type:complete len:84 (+) Transcript_8457:679-930(+)